MASQALPGLIAFLLGAAGGASVEGGKRKAKLEDEQRASFMEVVSQRAAVGDKAFFENTDFTKSAKRFGMEETMLAFKAVAAAPLTQEQREALLATQRQKTATAQAGTELAGAQSEALQTITQNLTGGGPTGAPPIPFEQLPPASQAAIFPPAGQVSAQVRGQDIQEQTERTRMDVELKKLAELKASNATEARIADARIDVMQTQNRIDRNRVRVSEGTLVDDMGKTFGLTVAESRAAMRFVTGKTDKLSEGLRTKIGKAATAGGDTPLDVLKEAHKLSTEGRKIHDDVLTAWNKKGAGKVKLEDEEVISRLQQANAKVLQGLQLQMRAGLITQEEMINRIALEFRVLTDDKEIVSPHTASGMQVQHSEALPGSAMTAEEEALLQEFTGK